MIKALSQIDCVNSSQFQCCHSHTWCVTNWFHDWGEAGEMNNQWQTNEIYLQSSDARQQSI